MRLGVFNEVFEMYMDFNIRGFCSRHYAGYVYTINFV